MALQKDYIHSPEKTVSEEICWYSNKPRKICCCHLCLRLLKKICAHQRHLSSSSIGNKANFEDNDKFLISLPLSAPSSQPTEFESRWENTPDDMHNQRSQENPPHRSRLRVVRSKSLEDFNVMSRSLAESIQIPNFREMCQSREKTNSKHSSTHQTFRTSIGSDSNETLPDPSLIYSSEDDNDNEDEDKALPKLVENIQSKKHLDVSSVCAEIKQEVISDEDDFSEALFNYSQEDAVILIYDSDEDDDVSTSSGADNQFESSKNVVLPFGSITNLKDEDTQPYFDLDEDTQEDQQQNQSLVQTEKIGTVLQSCEKQEVPLLSTSPKFIKKKSDNLTQGSFENCQNIKQEQKSDSDDSDDLFRDQIDSQATQLYTQTEWEYGDIKTEKRGKSVEKPYPLRRTWFNELVKHEKADSIKVIHEQETQKMPSSPSEDDNDGLNESLADDGDRGVRIKKELTTKDLDDDFFCPTQIDTPSDTAKLIKRNTILERKSKIKPRSMDDDDDDKVITKNRWKTTPAFYDEVESDDDDDDLFWCATQVDSSSNKRKPEVFVLTDSDEDIDDYLRCTQVDMESKLSPRGSQSSNTFKLPVFPQAKVVKKAHKSDNESWLPHNSGFPEEDSDSDESMFSVATQVDDPHALNEDEQVYMDQTQVDLSSSKQKSGKANTSPIARHSTKKRKLKHKIESNYKCLSDLHGTASNYDSDDSVFSWATQIDNDDPNDDTLLMTATQLDPEPSRSFKVPLSLKKHKMKSKAGSQNLKSFLKADEDYDSDDSAFSIATQVDAESSRGNKIPKLCLKNLKSQNKSTLKSVYVTDEDYDSDSSIFSVETQVDTPSYKRKGGQKNEEVDTPSYKIKSDQKDEVMEEDDDMSYFAATQIDTDIDGSVKKTKPMSLKDDIFKVPSFPNKKLKIVSPSTKDTKTASSSHRKSRESVAKPEAVDDKPFSNFLLGIAEGEVEKEIVTISPEKKEDINNSEETDKEFGQFLLDLSDDPAPDLLKAKTRPISQTCPVEPLRLKTKKEMREAFKNQPIKEASNKMGSPEKKLIQKTDLKISPTNDTWLPRLKKPVQKKTKLMEQATISLNISKARNRLEERYFLSHLDNSRVGWNKSSHIHYGSSTINDVQLPDENEIRKKRLPLTEGPRRRRPLPDIPIEHLPQENQYDIRDPAVNTPTASIEQKKSPRQSPVCTSTSPKKSPGGSVSNQFYRRSGMDTFKIPKLQNSKPKLPCNSVPQCKVDEQQVSSTEKCPPEKCLPKPASELIAQQLQLIQKIIDDKVIMSKNTSRDPRSNFGYHSKQPTKQTFSSRDSASSVINKKTNYPARTAAQTNSFDSRNQNLQDRINSKNNRDLILQHILKWNPKWLTEQKSRKTTPPIVKMDQLLPLLNSYTSLEDYQSIFRPLLLLEIWEGISKDFSANCSKQREWQVAFSNVQCLNSCLMDYIVYGVISIQDYNSKKQMMEGDLVKMNLQVQNPQNSSTKAENVQQNMPYPVMGVVESIRFYDPQLQSEILTRFPRLASLPELKSKFKVYRAIIKTHYRKLIHAFTDLMLLELISSLIPHLRQFQSLMSLSSSPLCPYILNPGKGESAASGVDIPSTKKYNSSQMKAIAAAAYIVRKPSNQPSYCLIQGPPGTGKSHTIIGIIHKIKEINKNCKVLLCAPSNGAIDELTRRLIKERHIARAESKEPLKVVRIGNPDNIHDDVSSYTIAELIKSNARAEIKNCASVYPELKRVCTNEKKIILKLKDPALREKNIAAEEQKRKLVKDLRNLQENKRFLTRQFQLTQSASEAPSLSYKQESELRHTILMKADVICSTLNTCGSSLYLNDLNSRPFDCIIIDEASQCTELDCLIPLQYNCCKLILVGDTEQLAPTVLSQKAAEYNYGQSLFERLCNHFKYLEETTSNPVIMLNCQYRMHPEICKFSSRYIYENKLLSDMNLELRRSPINIVPYLLFDIQQGQQIRSSNSGSLSNPLEAEFTINLCEYLISLNDTKSSLAVGIIATYNQQKNLLRQLLLQRKIYKIEVTTVDGFQGREKDIIIMSCVRAQGSCGKIGFLANRKRLNVALTRAKFAQYIIGHLDSLEHADEDWKSLIQDAHQRKLVVPISSGSSIKLAVQMCVKS